MCPKVTISLLCIIITAIGCTANTQPSPAEQKEGFDYVALENRDIFELQVYKDQLFAGTSKGFAVFSLPGMERMGIYMEKARIPAFKILSDSFWLISGNFGDIAASEGDNIFKSTDQGKSWVPYRNGFGGERYEVVVSMDVNYNKNASVIYARSGFPYIAKSVNSGKNWQLIYKGCSFCGWNNPVLAKSKFVKVVPNHPGYIWAGGQNSFFRSVLLISSNSGKTWKRVRPSSAETLVHDLLVDINQSDVLLAALGIGIRKSTNGGESWHFSLNRIISLTLTRSAKNKRIIYGSGRNKTGAVFFATSNDFGETWEIVEMESSAGNVIVYDMISIMQNGQEVLYFGTNSGIYSYTFEK